MQEVSGSLKVLSNSYITNLRRACQAVETFYTLGKAEGKKKNATEGGQAPDSDQKSNRQRATTNPQHPQNTGKLSRKKT